MQINALRGAAAIIVSFLFLQTGQAQSVLNFPRIVQGGGLASQIAVTNPSPYYADVQFSFFEEDGSPIAAPRFVNPVSYRVAPWGQLALTSSLIFGDNNVEGWVQASSLTPGLQGSYSIEDSRETFESSEAVQPLTNQVIPYIPDGDGATAEIVITNPGTKNATPTIVFYDNRGNDVRLPDRPTVGPREQWTVTPPRGATWARITSSPLGVVATEFAKIQDTRVLINAHAFDPASTRVAPHFVSSRNYQSVLAVVNPNPAVAALRVSLFERGRNEPVSRETFELAANGTRVLRLADLWPQPFRSIEAGWLLVESDGQAMTGVTLFESDRGVTATALQNVPMERLLFSRIADTDLMYTGVAFVNTGSKPASVEMTLSRADGTTAVKSTLSLEPNQKISKGIGELGLLPDTDQLKPGAAFLSVRSTAPVYALQVFDGKDGGGFVSSEPVVGFPSGASPTPLTPRPAIVGVEPENEARAGSSIQVHVDNLGSDVVVLLGERGVPVRVAADGSLVVDIPTQTEPGYVSMKVRSGGRDSLPKMLRISPADALQLPATLEGRVFYQKIEVNDGGLDFSRVSYVPVRHGVVQIYDPSMGAVVSVSQTDDLGHFTASAPAKSNLIVRVLSRRSDSMLQVADNTNNDALYVIERDNVNAIEPSPLWIVDTTRRSGAFNILEAIQRANDLVSLSDPLWPTPGVTVYWSPRNTSRYGNVREGLVGTTRFNLTSNTAYVLGDRATDSDEFDDAVILHEYAHMLAVKVSRDDSPGGVHGLGEIEDPRLAWSEGFANFFSSAVRNDPIYRDSRGNNGTALLRYDLENNVPSGDVPGYWSETSTGSLLWDLFDDHDDPGDSFRASFPAIWTAVADLRSERYVYLPSFLDRFIERNPSAGDATRNLALLRKIDYRSNADPTVENPFPRPITSNEPVYGEVDSLTTRRANLMQSAHFFWFNSNGGPVTIRLEVIGLGPASEGDANDLDLYLFDTNGKLIANSSNGGNGQSETINLKALPAGAYVVEARSFYTKSKGGGTVYNSGRYRLTLTR